MKTKILAAIAILALTVTACQKDPEDTTDNGGTNGDYQPTTAGSTWQYESTSSGTYTETVLPGDTTIEGETYYKLDNSENGRRYINKSNGVYKARGYVQEIDQNVTMTFLKDATVGTTWSDVVNITQSGITIPVTFQHTIASRDGEKVVHNNTYKDVIAVNTTLIANSPLLGGSLQVGTGREFYAKNVGAITTVLHIQVEDLDIDVSDSTYLISSTIK